ncbi:MAG: hypothetical protein NTZ59_02435 [Bacteroidetes bacterium]|nr:hypothetical protein [Bacteroidota bacterium]
MFFTSKWANLAVFAVVALVVTMVVVANSKADKDGKISAFKKDPTTPAPTK